MWLKIRGHEYLLSLMGFEKLPDMKDEGKPCSILFVSLWVCLASVTVH